MWAVTAISSPDGTAVSTTQIAVSRQVGGAASSALAVAVSSGRLTDRNSRNPQPAINKIKTKKPKVHVQICSPSRVYGSTISG